MKISVLGTGMVGRAVAARLDELGHEVAIGTRNPEQTLSRTEPDAMGTPAFTPWQRANSGVELLSYSEAGAHGEVVINATNGANSLAALEATGGRNLAGKVLIDIALALDFSEGMPPKLLIASDDSLAEQIQRTYPEARVVKTLNTIFCDVMVNPSRVPGAHNVFVAGNDESAKTTAKSILNEFGWPSEATLDLGGIEVARSVELYMPLYFTLHGVLGTFDFNIAMVRTS
ncbi:NADPH-dependent F420 reductase [Arthrobacter sp. ISL-5]|uniref:NADPH-dependent F420 reductase n=1 Tax=Arthrobacter sp. ISL-5 TaxID=2819111 RepID=UPI001BE57529|nr:NAD(P)-binding domain-containing protein [Arthrobacter sp. ISL-5]MBT2555968.1 NAD(P)-binding domain-containing protein [Arthrobacter sp. ISL-5]